MIRVFAVAADLLHEAVRRKWFLALGGAITLLLLILAFSLQLDVVDGALAASRLFGDDLGGVMRPADVALRPLYKATAYLIFYAGLAFGILACADFAPSLLSPGRIEHLLSLPVRRSELIAGTFLGVLLIAVAGAVYGSAGFTLILGFKSGLWSFGPILAALLACVSFTAIYGAMLAAATLVRSASLSAAVGGGVLVAGVVASYRADLSSLFNPGIWRGIFEGVTALLPRIATLADASADVAASVAIETGDLARLLAGVALFGLAMLSIAAWRMERLDF